MKPIALFVGTIFLVAACGNDAWAQIPQYTTGPQTGTGGPTLKRSNRPAVSAYTGLLGSSPGVSGGVGYQYFTRVQPQISAQRGLASLGRSVNRLQSQSGTNTLSISQLQLLQQQQSQGLALGTTGHATGYFVHTRYFATDKQGGTVLSSGGGLGVGGGSSPGLGSAGISPRRY